jgi:DeoR/GlpR family transcriptional regulator of sugar metabolism
MDVAERRENIAGQVAAYGEVDFQSLATQFGVSEMTIRRDVEALEEDGFVRRIVGGAISVRNTSTEPPFESRASASTQAKERIAQAVVELLIPGETVLLDSGSTVLSVARVIRRKDLKLTIVTPSTLAALELADAPDTTVYLTGGQLRTGELSLIGPEAINSVRRFNCDTFVMGVAGVDLRGGISDSHYDEAHVKQAGMASSGRVIIAADQTKLGRMALVKIADLSDFAILVTDAPEDHPSVKEARSNGMQVVTVTAQPEVVR